MSQKNGENRHVGKFIKWWNWELMSLKNITIFIKKNSTEKNNSSNNCKSSKISKSVTENMSVKKHDASRIWV